MLSKHLKPASVKQTGSKDKGMTWAQRLKQVLGIEIQTCDLCGGAVKIIASIEAAVVIKKILDHLDKHPCKIDQKLPPSRASPQFTLF